MDDLFAHIMTLSIRTFVTWQIVTLSWLSLHNLVFSYIIFLTKLFQSLSTVQYSYLPLGNEIDLLLYNHILISDNNCKTVLNILLGLITFSARVNDPKKLE